MKNKPKIVDLFCGCGGFGLGAELAGFHTLAALDIDKTLQSAYKKNFPNTYVVNADLSKLNSDDWKKIVADQEIDGVIGGPPCQGYSRIGVSDEGDPRRQLLMDFFRHVNLLQPKFFVMENVEGLMDKKNIGQLHSAINSVDARYTVLEPIIIDASQYGAPTKRKRVIVIGYDSSRMESVFPSDFTPPNSITTVRDAIRDIREPINQSDDSDDYGWASYRNLKVISKYAQKMRKAPPRGLGCATAKKFLKEGKCSGHFDTLHTDEVIERFSATPQGKVDPVSKAKKLSWEGLCPTLRAGTGADKGSYQSVRPLHPAKGRVITVREAARLQGFPDWFCFHPTKWHSFRMIGNSVSPIVSNTILSVIYSKLLQCQRELSA